jgi:transcriptional repressor NrdR
MRCPYCGSLDTQVKDSRPQDDSSTIRRRRVCPDCGGRFTTFERVQLRELTVVKRSGRRVPFERDKLQRSIDVALRKRPVEPERVERMINGVVRQLESLGDGEVTSEEVGELVMEGLKGLDDVAYVRFASVYKNFREARDFEEILGALAGEPEAEPGSVLPKGALPKGSLPKRAKSENVESKSAESRYEDSPEDAPRRKRPVGTAEP